VTEKKNKNDGQSQISEPKSFTVGRKKKYAKQEDIEALQKALTETQRTIGDFIKKQEERITLLEESQQKIIKALTETPSPQNPQATGQSEVWTGIARAITQNILTPPDPLQKLARRALLEDLMFGRTLRRAVLSAMGKRYIKRYTKELSEAIEEVEGTPMEAEETEREGA